MFTPTRRLCSLAIAAAGTVAFEAAAIAGPATITIAGASCQTNAQIVIDVNLSNANDLIVGGQFFLQYDNVVLDFISADAGDAPFSLEVFEQVNETNGTIDYAVGVPGGGPGTMVPTTMFRLTFMSLADQCVPVADLVTFRTAGAPTLLTDAMGTSIAPTLVDIQPIAIDTEAPVLTCPGDVAVDCMEDTDPGSPFAVVTGGVAIYYNDNGLGEFPGNQAYLRTQASYSNLNGAVLNFSDTPLDGEGFTWEALYQTALDQFGLDFIMMAPTHDGSVSTPTLTAYDNTDDTVTGATSAGAVEWAISHYTGSTEGPADMANGVINSLLRGLTPGNGSVVLTRSDLTLAGSVFTVVIEGFLESDGLNHWEALGMPDSPIGEFGLTSPIYFAGTLTYDASGDDGSDLIDFYEGTITLTAGFPSPEVGFATATDNCGAPAVSYTDSLDAGTGCAGDPLTITRTWQAVDDCGNTTTCDQVIIVEDDQDPTFLFVPADITTPSYAGGCTADLESGDIGMPIATDNCDAIPAITFLRSDGMANIDDPYDPSDSPITITWTATDECGNFTDYAQTITVTATNDLDVIVELTGVWDITDAPLTFQRCVTFELHNCIDDTTTTIDRVLDFSSSGLSAPATAAQTISVPCGLYDCITAQDVKHTLRKTDDDDFAISGINYTADFSNTGGDDDALISGSMNDDDYIDILDFGVFVVEFGTDYGSPNVLCVAGDNADFNADGVTSLADFSFIMINFLQFNETDCCETMAMTFSPRPHRARRAIHRISTHRLHATGRGQLAVADINEDGWLDQYDIAAFVSGARP